MSENEFLTELENALSGSVSPSLINENLRYYEEYIETEKLKGRSVYEVMDELGDPRLIARTIIDTADSRDKRGADAVFGGNIETTYGTDEDKEYDSTIKRITRISGLRVIAVLAAVLIVFFLVFTLALFLVGSFILAFWPAILFAFIIWMLLRLVK